MLNTETRFPDTERINDRHRHPNGPQLEDRLLRLLEGEFAGVLKPLSRGETYGGD